MASLLARSQRRLKKIVYRLIDPLYMRLDKRAVVRTANINLIPIQPFRKGGKFSYAEWAHVIGVFQTLLYTYLENKKDPKILDVGCGTGLLGIAAEPFLRQGGSYVGIDVMKSDVDFCRGHYDPARYSFIHLNVHNPTYSPEQSTEKVPWPLADNTFDMVTALSVWTHLNEEDALYYFKEIGRVLKPGGKALVTFFLLDDVYQDYLKHRVDGAGRYHRATRHVWIFDQPAYGSREWFHRQKVKAPEDAIGVTPAGLKRLLEVSGLKQVVHHQGNWKELPGLYFQDALVFEKA